MIRAVKEGKKFKGQNTSYDPDTGEVRLHGNLIANVKATPPFWTMAGWGSHTTRDRVNGLIDLLGDSELRGVCQRDHEQHVMVGDKTVPIDTRKRYPFVSVLVAIEGL
ncbi:MAG: hypothetical protein DI640_13090 [Sphingomonas taxi]|uniref:Uncharacterized protein n=1 Tax=Sphingomonas taxi TaxID=1549858 RepID=A0A2W4YR93_9SPHN|nr:MAG: hypothetical protein DI640_13090 [Sphingomonas taxi]